MIITIVYIQYDYFVYGQDEGERSLTVPGKKFTQIKFQCARVEILVHINILNI